MGDIVKDKYRLRELEEESDRILCCCIGWRKLFEQAQDILREVRKKSLLPDDLYLKAVRLCELEALPKKYWKGEKR